MKKIVLLVILCSTSVVFSQEKIKKLAPSVTKLVVQSQKEIDIENKINLQEFIENIYINFSKYFNEGALPLVEKGEFHVVLLDKDSKHISMKSSDFKNYTPNDIKEFTFDKSLGALYGLQGYYFGTITIKLKE